jgi:hypothetical protein
MKFFVVGGVLLLLVLYWIFGGTNSSLGFGTYVGKDLYISDSATSTTQSASSTATTTVIVASTTPIVTHIATPKHVKALYMSSWVAGTPSVRNKLIKLIEDTELNAVVIDVKDNTGTLSWDGRIRDLNVLIEDLHKKDIYIIARIAAFQDPLYVKLHPELAVKNKTTGGIWKDHKGVPWIDTGSRVMWTYVADIGKEAYARGFDELNYDYIRFPTDGALSEMQFPISGERGLHDKRGVTRDFYAFLHDEFSPVGIPISGDVFGIILVNANETKTLGQDLGDALMYFDYVAPMVYPSHFYAGTAGFQNPADHPGPIITYAMKGAVSIAVTIASSTQNASGTPLTASSTLIAKLRPWYQDFDMGATYTKEMVRAQMDAGYALNVNSWMLWDPANKYTPSALHTASTTQ